MQLNPTEISDLIKSRIEQFDVVAEARTEGTVVSLTACGVVLNVSQHGIRRSWLE